MTNNHNAQKHQERRRAIRLRRSKISGEVSGLAFKIAHTTEEYEQAFELVWRRYRSAGLESDDSSGIRFTKYHLLPGTKVFVVIAQDVAHREKSDIRNTPRVIGTITLILDSRMGIPVEEVCGEEIQKMRKQKRSLAEIVALAIDPDYGRQELDTVMNLFKIVFAYARYKGVDDLLCSVTRRHIEFYRTLLLFEPVGDMKPYSYANQMEVQAHRLNMKRIERVAKKVYSAKTFDADLYSFFFEDNKEFERTRGEGCPLSTTQIRYFITQRTRMIDSIDYDTFKILSEEYNKAGCAFLDESEWHQKM